MDKSTSSNVPNEHRKLLLQTVYREAHENFDVILMSSDKTQFKAHRLFLSASSPFFHDILQSEDCESDIVIFLNDVGHEELEAILELIYLGATIIRNDQHDSIFHIAKSLKIHNITNIAAFQSSYVKDEMVPDIKEEEKDLSEKLYSSYEKDENITAEDKAADELSLFHYKHYLL